MDNRKMVTAAGHLDTLLRIMDGFAKAFAIVFAVFIMLMKFFGEKMVVPGSLSLDLDFVKIHLAEEYSQITGLFLSYIDVILISGILIGIAIRYGIRFLRKVLEPMKEGRPFDAEAAVHLRKFAWVVLIGGGLIQVLGIAGRTLLARAMPMDAIFASPAIESVEYVFTVDFGFVWMFCVVMLLSRIFEYGQRLQQESDETL